MKWRRYCTVNSRMIPMRDKQCIFCILILLSLTAVGCVHKGHSEHRRDVSAEIQRSLFEPIRTGQHILKNQFETADYERVVFDISQGRVRISDQAFSDSALLSENRVVFLRLKAAESVAGDLFYFDPRNMRMVPLTTGSNDSSGVLMNAGNIISVFRAVETGSSRLSDRRTLNIFRFTFTITRQKDIRFEHSKQLTHTQSSAYLPALMAKRKTVVYLQATEDSGAVFMSMGVNGEHKQRLSAHGTRFADYLKALGPDRVAVALDRNGYTDLYQYDFRTQTIRPYTADAAPAMLCRDKILGSSFESGQVVPVIFSLPEAFGVEDIAALAAARNPEVNRKRALLGAALAEAGQAKLDNYPVLNLAVAYTPVVGLLTDSPTLLSGDFLSEGIARGIIGLFQPLLDFRRNLALSEAGLWRARIAAAVVENELNEQVSSAVETFFEIRYYQELVRLNDEIIRLQKMIQTHYQSIQRQGETLRLKLMAARRNIQNAVSERAFYNDRAEFLKSRLRLLCGLPANALLVLNRREYEFASWDLPGYSQLRQIALLNHPRLNAAERVMSQAFYLDRAGPGRRPTLGAGADYGHSRRDFHDSIDDYITLSLNARLPLSTFKARKIHRHYWKTIMDSHRIELKAQAGRVALSMQEARMDLAAAQRDFRAKKFSCEYELEELRIARLHKKILKPGSGRDVSSSDIYALQVDFLESLKRLEKVRMDLGIRFVRLWREMGLAGRINREVRELCMNALQKDSVSVWLWETRELLANRQSCEHIARTLDKKEVRTIYLYCGAGAAFVTDPVLREKIRLFINICWEMDIHVWALLGEPQWLTDPKGVATCVKSVQSIAKFNSEAGPFEPGLAGIKFDIEPHADPAWDTDAAFRTKQSHRYLELISSARKKIDQDNIPVGLRVDIPYKYFQPHSRGFVRAIFKEVDAVTIMCYHNNPEKIMRMATAGLKEVSVPAEIGIELSAKAPKTDTLHGMNPNELDALLSGIRRKLAGYDSFSGIVVHDVTALLKTMEKRNNED